MVEGQPDKPSQSAAEAGPASPGPFAETAGQLESLLGELLDKSPMPAFCKDTQGRYLAVNAAFCDLLGHRREDLIGAGLWDLAPTEVAEQGRQAETEILRTGRTQVYPSAVHHPARGRREVIVTKYLLEDAQGRRAIGGTLNDVTDRQRAEQNVQAERMLLFQMIDRNPVPMIVLDGEGHALRANQAAEALLGVTPGPAWSVWDDPNLDTDELHQRIEQAMAGQTVDLPECLYSPAQAFPGGREGQRWLKITFFAVRDGEGGIRHVVMMPRDVSEERQATEALRTSQEKYRALVEGAGETIANVDADGTLLFVNQTGAAQLGVPAADVIGRKLWDLFGNEAGARMIANVQQVIWTGEPVVHEAPIRIRERTRWYRTHIQPLGDRQGRYASALVIARDFTLHRQAEQSLRARLRHEQAISCAAAELAGAFDFDESLEAVLDQARQATDARRVCLYEHDASSESPGRALRRRAVWAVSEADEPVCPAEMEYERLGPEALKVLRAGRQVTFSEAGADTFRLAVPVQAGSEYWGFLGLEAPRSLQRDVRSQLGLLAVLGSLIGAALARERAERLLKLQRDVNAQLNVAATLEEALGTCLDAGLDATGLDCATAHSIEEDGSIRLRAHRGLSAEFVQHVSWFPADSWEARASAAPEPVFGRFDELGRPLEKGAQEGVRGVCIIPVRDAQAGPVACFVFGSRRSDEIPRPWRSALEAVMGSLGGAVSRIAAQDRSRRDEARLRSILRSLVGSAVFVQAPDGQYTFAICDPRIEQRIGRSIASVLGRYPEDVLPAEHVQQRYQDVRHVFQTGQPVLRESHIEGPRGRLDYELLLGPMIDADGRISAVVGFQRDITDRREMDAALRQSEERYRSLVASLPCAVYRACAEPPFQVEYCSDNIEAIIGYRSSEIVGEKPEVFYPALIVPEDAHKVRLPFLNAVHRGGTYDLEYRIRNKDGQVRWVEERGRYMPGVDGEPGHIDGVLFDLTDARRAQAELRQARRRQVLAAESERRRLAAEMHDSIGQQLTALHLALRGRLAEQADMDIHRFANAVEALIREVRQISHGLYPPTLESMGLAAALRQLRSAPAAGGPEVNVVCDEELHLLRLSPEAEIALFRIAQEALNNAMKHANASRVDVVLERDENRLMLTIADDGKGFDTQQTEPGLGLGSMAERADAVGAKFLIDSGEGGTQVTVVAQLWPEGDHSAVEYADPAEET
mgnify:CR=1 FL=1